ncbi:hypothetical protein MXB_2667 [Myxobolus squamalis]|nr:hypothetical protein MXB_2667 [Myxobolus squamalis]
MKQPIPYNFFDPYHLPSNSNGLTRNGKNHQLRQDWEPEAYLNPLSAGFKILEGNVRHATVDTKCDGGPGSNFKYLFRRRLYAKHASGPPENESSRDT